MTALLQLSNVANVSEVTVSLPGNAVSDRYGTLVASNSSRTFLYGECRSLTRISTYIALFVIRFVGFRNFDFLAMTWLKWNVVVKTNL